MVFSGMVIFADVIEIYLPGVITQAVSCELGVTEFQEGVLGFAMYGPMAIITIIGGPVSNRFGRRTVIMISLITSVVFTVVCAVVHNYYTLILSRGLIGMTVGFNVANVGVFFGENVSSPAVNKIGTYIRVMGFGVATMWVAVLGYIFLELLGWRVFLVSASLPIFIPPIIILAFFLKPAAKGADTEGVDEKLIGVVEVILKDEAAETEPTIPEILNSKARIFRACMANFINLFQGHGTILLVPSLVRQFNNLTEEESSERTAEDCTLTSINGSQFLILVYIAVADIVGGILAFLLPKLIPFRVLHCLATLVIGACFAVITVYKDLLTVTVSMTIATLCFAVTRNNISVLQNDPRYYGPAWFAVGSGWIQGVGMIGSMCGVGIAAFFQPIVSTTATLALSLVQVGVIISITEIK